MQSYWTKIFTELIESFTIDKIRDGTYFAVL